MTRRVLVVDDDVSIRETFAGHLQAGGCEVGTAESAEQALGRIAEFDPGLVITDLRLPGMDGVELLTRIREARPDTAVLVITAHEDMRSAVAAMKAGAYDYLVKPLDLDQIDVLVERAFRERSLVRRVRHLAHEAAEPYALDRLVGRDPAMIEICKRIGKVAATRMPVLIRGETGTGKEVVARAIHFNADDADEPFVAVNCTALPEPLLESELFGHVRGAFTGAVSDRKGRFELAGSGTVFLDEIGDTSAALQAKLLRVLQEREVTPVGSERPRPIDARVIAATHRPLEEMVRQGRFREDLWFRLRVVEIRVPPLRERRADIPLLAEHFVRRIAEELHRPPPRIPAQVMEALAAHDWPGNVRELENALARAVVLGRGSVLSVEELGLVPAAPAVPAEAAAGDESLAGHERAHLLRVLRRTGGNKRQACRRLRISRPRLDRLLQRHGIVATEYGGDGNGGG
jgi:DNA-binding NtrC family response regulator